MIASRMMVLLLVPYQSVDGPAKTQTNGPLSFNMRPAMITLDDGFLLEQEIKNVGDRSIYFGFCPNTWLIRDLEANVSFPWSGVKRPPDEEPRREDLLLLDPGTGVGSVLGGYIPIRWLVRKPGRYEMTLSCSSKVDWKEHKGIRVWNKNDGALTASFEFEVVE